MFRKVLISVTKKQRAAACVLVKKIRWQYNRKKLGILFYFKCIEIKLD